MATQASLAGGSIAQDFASSDPLEVFMYALKAPETRRQWPRRLKMVFDFLQISGTLEEQARAFADSARAEYHIIEEFLKSDYYVQGRAPPHTNSSRVVDPKDVDKVTIQDFVNDNTLNFAGVRRHRC